jgi:hypothetical protein
MKLKLKNTPEQVELVKALGSKDAAVAREAQEAFAAFIGPVIQKVIKQSATAGLVYEDVSYDEDDSPSYPLDLYYDQSAGHVTVWSQSMAGGLPTSLTEGVKELKISTYRLDAAISWLKKYARRARLDVVSKALERMSQEVLLKQERNAWAVILKALANSSSSNSVAANSGHILATNQESKFSVADISRLMTHMKRISASFANGTADPSDSFGLTDMYVSPEVLEQIRGFAYNPLNTENTAGGVMGLPESVREGVWRGAGMSEIYGVAIHDLVELGRNKKYNTLFSTFAQNGIAHTSETVDGTQSTNFSDAAASASGDEILIGIDASKEAFIRPVAVNADNGATFTALPDDQFAQRADKVGFYGSMEEGRVCIDARAVAGLVM